MAPWSPEEDRKLLLAIVNLTSATPDWEAIGTQVGRTGESVRQHYQKLKKEAAAANDGSVAAPATPTTAAKPRKRKTPAKKTTKADDGDEDDEMTRPITKKVKAEVQEDDE